MDYKDQCKKLLEEREQLAKKIQELDETYIDLIMDYPGTIRGALEVGLVDPIIPVSFIKDRR